VSIWIISSSGSVVREMRGDEEGDEEGDEDPECFVTTAY